ncbi:pyridoxal phosphate-dependent aminotransferase [Corticicoccus populi]|uniref:Pyridoxal phosphate-dependent aminotransferase n=1 Tax=Corticicoccus populi TaxID=1812821 RepID=A0ABW5WX44_9STAP
MIYMDRNTCPVIPLSEEDIISAVQNTALNLYPEDEYTTFIRLYAERYGLDAGTIELANGSDEWIQKIIMTLGKSGVMSLQPDFNMYQIYANQAGIRFYSIGSNADYSFDYDHILDEVRKVEPSVFFISNPHNPTGILFPDEFLNTLAEVLSEWNGYLVVDEAYVEFAPKKYSPVSENTLIIRTMSKMYGLAGLRIGILIAEGTAFDAVTRINHPYPVNSLSLNLGVQLLKNKDTLNTLIDYQKNSKKALEDSLSQAENLISIKKSYTNFIFTYGPQAESLALYLKDHGFTARIYEEPYLNNVVRYSIISLEDYPAFKQLITDWKESI